MSVRLHDRALTLELSQSTVMVEEMLQDLGGASTKNLNVLGQYLVIHGRLQDAERCLEEVRIRFNRKIGVQIRGQRRKLKWTCLSIYLEPLVSTMRAG